MTDAIRLFPGQAEFVSSLESTVGMFTGAGYGKSFTLALKVVQNAIRQNGWHVGHGGAAESRRLQIIVGAPEQKHLERVTIPYVKQWITDIEQRSGQRLRAQTGQGKDGWFAAKGSQRQELLNGVDLLFFPLHSTESAVATNAAGLAIDEVTMLPSKDIWLRARQRVRDTRAKFLQTCVVGTPESNHFIYGEFFDDDGAAKPNTRVITASSIENDTLPRSWFQDLAATASQQYIDMQVHGKWLKGVSGERFGRSFDTKRHCLDMSHVNIKRDKFYLGIDPGYRTGSWLVITREKSRGRAFFVYDEIVVKDMTTEQIVQILQRRGYGAHNIQLIGIDADGRKQRSTSRVTDIDIIKRGLGVTPKHLGSHAKYNIDIRLREDYIEGLLDRDRIFINSKLIPRTRSELGIVNALRSYSHEKVRNSEGEYKDQPSSETNRKWKHPIDALHYAMLWLDRSVYDRYLLHQTTDPDERRRMYGLR